MSSEVAVAGRFWAASRLSGQLPVFGQSLHSAYFRLTYYVLAGKPATLPESSEERGMLDSWYDNLQESIESISKNKSAQEHASDARK